MTIGISLYRARVGDFRYKAAQLSVFKLAFISASQNIAVFSIISGR